MPENGHEYREKPLAIVHGQRTGDQRKFVTIKMLLNWRRGSQTQPHRTTSQYFSLLLIKCSQGVLNVATRYCMTWT